MLHKSNENTRRLPQGVRRATGGVLLFFWRQPAAPGPRRAPIEDVFDRAGKELRTVHSPILAMRERRGPPISSGGP
ncbi:hypothetical protein EVAR_18815_1 [Eumeta japonica]|uniref:Uncharacterized protein n=1 Tax=Eumeta variegata TaxID=151549 RepID=A0A4C1UMX2_EUMVA|nr:hypothetical protein EVAR_18815_1 [Eumeta japonica]